MALSEIPPNLIPNEPDLSDVLAMHRKGIFLEINCHHVGTVQAFDATNQTAKVTINYKRTFFKPDDTGVIKADLRDYPIAVDAPVVFLGGGGYSLTFPVAVGDECLVLFNDRDIDAWFAGSASSPNPTSRLHSFADAFVLVGVRSLPNVILSPDTDGVAIRNRAGTVKLKLKDSGSTRMENPTGYFELQDNADVDFDTGTVQGHFGNGGKVSFTNALGEMIALLYDMLNALTTGAAGGFPFVLPPTYATSLVKFQSFKA